MAAIEDGVTTVVIALRADFYHRCAEFDDLRMAVERNQRYIGAMSKDELRTFIEKSAQLGDWELEQGLVDLLLDDAAAEPGALPLLSHALLETWLRRRGRRLTFVGYLESGRVHGAIAQTAEDVFHKQLTLEEQVIAKNIFMQLTELGEGVQDTRRRVPFVDLIPSTGQAAKVERVLHALENARLITASHEAGVRENERNVYVDVTHEALIREWQTLRDWLKDNREGLRVRRHLLETAKEWERRKRDPSELYRGLRLEQAWAWVEGHASDLTKTEKAFLDAGRLEHQETKQRELIQIRRARNRAWAAFCATAIALFLAIVVGWQLYDQNRKSQVEILLSEFTEMKKALKPVESIAKLKAAEEAAKKLSVVLRVDVSTEIGDVVRYVAAQWVRQGEGLAAQGDYAGTSTKLREVLSLDPPPPPDLPIYVLIEPGEFLMGTGENEMGVDEEKPQHSVYLSGYWIMRTEVTNELYARCVREGPCTKPRSTHWDKPQFANWPVNGIDWDQANTYAQWVGGHLPTEAEWEKACRGTDGRIYPWGNDVPSPHRLNYQKSDIYEIASVGSYATGANGLYDMAGNVYEWTSSRYQPYPYNANDGREAIGPNVSWVYRGGSFNSSDSSVRCAFRNKSKPGIIDNSVGFRVVLPSE
jgi:formylglycine-generating enzyme required for sulfatase activity